MSIDSTLRHFLCEARQRIASRAVAFVSPSRDCFVVHAASDAEKSAAREKFELIADALLLDTRNGREPVVRNRVRYEPGGPLIGRFLAAPVREGKRAARRPVPAARPADDAFADTEARIATKLAHHLSKVMSAARDPVTGLLTRASVDKLVDWRLQFAR